MKGGGDERPLVCHIIYSFEMGGLENGLVNLLNSEAFKKFNHRVLCIESRSEFTNRVSRDDIRILALNRSKIGVQQLRWRLFQIFKKIKPQIIHTRNISALDAVLPAFAACKGKRIHSEHGWNSSDIDGPPKKHTFLRRMHRPLINQFVALSCEIHNYLSYQVGVAESRLTTIPNGVDTQKFRPLSIHAFDRPTNDWPFCKSDFVIGTVGRADLVKNQMFLLHVFSSLRKKHPELPLKLVVVGDGPLLSDLKALADQLEIRQHCWIPGSRNDIPTILRHLNVFVLPSLLEGMSNSILEAMASALPVLASNVGGNPELVKPFDRVGLFSNDDGTDLEDQLWRLASDLNLTSRMGEANRTRVIQNFSLDAMSQKYSRLYDTFLVPDQTVFKP